MKVLVTGSEGFIGCHLTVALARQGHEIVSHTRAISDLAQERALDGFDKVDHVFHLAAKTFVPDSWIKPHDYFRVNLMGTVTVLEYCRKYNCSMTFISSYVYGEPQYLPVDERHPVVAVSPYHMSKIACENLCQYYSNWFGVKITVLRPFNVYGKGQSEAFLLPTIVMQAMDESVDEIRVMDLAPKRDYVYIDDVVQAMLLTMNPIENYVVYNVGSGESVSVEDSILTLFKVTGKNKRYSQTGEKRLSDVSDCVADIHEISRQLGFKPKYDLAAGISAWLQNNKQ